MNYGDWVLIKDRRGRRYLLRLQEGGRFVHHRGAIDHAKMLALGPGSSLGTEHGESFSIHRPTLEDYVLHMPREATPTYPKDAATMAFLLDLAPGMTVLESGTGSGGLTLYLARAVGPTGKVLSFEANPRHLRKARHNLESFENPLQVQLFEQDLQQAQLLPQSLDGVALDVMEPWNLLSTVASAIKPDRFVVAYMPNLTQAMALLETIKDTGLPFFHERTLEVSHREWDLRPPVSHPKFQQVGHTAFLTLLRRKSL